MYRHDGRTFADLGDGEVAAGHRDLPRDDLVLH
jgi:hypothetical protein